MIHMMVESHGSCIKRIIKKYMVASTDACMGLKRFDRVKRSDY